LNLIERVSAFARRHELWRPETRVVCALSGGSDSVALLFVLYDFDRAGALILDSAAHLHHEIRGVEADADQQFCRALCDRLAVPFVTNHVDVPALAARERVSRRAARGRRFSRMCARLAAPTSSQLHTR
jgi:tRNA(Ile)-lysidine synthase